MKRKGGLNTDEFKEAVPFVIDAPEKLPQTEEQEKAWQDQNYSYWQSLPMRYDFAEEVEYKEFSPEFYKEIDTRFFSVAREFLPWKKIPFDNLINFDELKDKTVLEVGTGNGSHAQLLAQHAKEFYGIDITDYAVKSTTERFRHFNLVGTLKTMDAQVMDFPDNYFDFIWSWGVIHHSANPPKIVKEMQRVLKPGGKVTLMVYYRSWWYYYVCGFVRGLLSGDLMELKSIHKIKQKRMDGALARYYTIRSFKKMASEYLNVTDAYILGQKNHLNPLIGRPGKWLFNFIKILPESITRFLTNTLRMGFYLVVEMEKPN